MMTTSQFMSKQNNDFISNYEIDSLIKKFSNNSTQQQHDASLIKTNVDILNHSLSSANSIQQLQQQTKNNNLHYKKLIENICQNNLQNYPLTKTKLNEQTLSDRAKFFNTLKSLFAIFDPECRGFIDINELNNLGAQKNEILNDVISYLLNKKEPNYEFSNNLYFVNGANSKQPENIAKNNTDSRSSSGNSSRSSSANSIQLKSDDTKNSFIKNLRSKNKEIGSPASNKIARKLKKLEANNIKASSTSSSASPTSTKSSLSSSTNQLSSNLEGYYVTFEEFVNAADLVLDKRKKEKILMQSNRIKENQQQLKSYSYMGDDPEGQINSNFINGSTQSTDSFNKTASTGSNLFQGGSTSLNNIYKSSGNGYVNKLTLMRSSMQPPPPPPPPIDYNTIQRPKIQNTRLSLNTNQNSQSHLQNHHGNYMPLLNALQTHNNQTSSSSSINSMNGATLSQAFENVTNTFDATQKLSKDIHTSINKPLVISEDSNFISNANSFDLGGLIDKENFLLQQGLSDIEQIRQWYSSQLRDNRQKHANIKQLKRQNLFSIDKMLIDLKSLNDLNSVLCQFLSQNKERDYSSETGKNENMSLNSGSNSFLGSSANQAPLPTYKDYVESFDLNKTDSDIDQYLKEKSEKIENLQKEKSNLIRRLFEMKSESANLNRNIIQLQTNNQPLTNNFKNSSPAKNILVKQQNYDRLPNHIDTALIGSNKTSHPNTNPHIITKAKAGVNSARASLNHSTICNFIELPNGGFSRNTEVNSRPVAGHSYYPQQQHFQPIHNQSPI